VVTPGEALPWELDPADFPLLAQLGRNLTALAREGRLDPVIGRAREMDEVLDVLGKRRTNNPCLVGEPGVGKTAVVEGVAQRLLSAPGELGKRIIVELSTADLLAGTPCASFSERLNGLKDDAPAVGWWSSSTRFTPWSARDPPARGPRTRPTS
jgi:ATP-dependent Clp protease ATP-binding subunit ClpC